jgi:nitronate monooxygenase
VSQKFKETFLQAEKDDIVLVSSPVGMPGRAINTPFVRKMAGGEDVSTKECKYKCLKKCSYRYCISDRLIRAHDGNVEEGLVFSGANTYKMKEILSVHEIFNRFVKEAESVYKEK